MKRRQFEGWKGKKNDMKSITYTVTDENGIHARPAGIIVKTAKAFTSAFSIEMKTDGGESRIADAKKLFAVMGLGAKKGSILTVTAVGEDENDAAVQMEDAMKKAGL